MDEAVLKYALLNVVHCLYRESSCGCFLLLLRTTSSCSLRCFDRCLVSDGCSLTHTHHATACLPWALQLASCGLPKDVNFDQVTFQRTLDRKDGLDEERVGIFQVDMHEAHHGNSHQLRFVLRLELAAVVFLDGGGDELGLLTRSHGCRFDILQGCEVCLTLACASATLGLALHTSLLFDLYSNVEVEAENEQVGDDVEDSDSHQDLRIIKGNSLRYLHHSKHDDKVGTVIDQPLLEEARHLNLHCRTDSHSDGACGRWCW